MRVIVVGGGLLGLATAWSLRGVDADVLVLESAARVGGGASRGNAGWVCPTQVAPLAAPGLVKRLTRDALSPASALYIRPRGLPPLVPFLLRLAAGATRSTYDERVSALRVLADRAWPALEEAVADGLEVTLHRTGILSVFSQPAHAHAALGLLADQAPLVDSWPEQCVSSKAAAGYVLEGDGFVDPGQLVEALAATAEVRVGQVVRALTREGAGWSVATADGPLRGDAVVLAAGAATPGLAALTGHRLRVVAGKGYSFTVPMSAAPSRPVHLEEAHVVLTPLPGGVRVAGTMELGDRTNRLDSRRVQAIVDAAAPWLEGVDWGRRTDEWVGERPLTSDGLPVIGELEAGLFVATGHGMYGVTLAMPTGEVLARAVVGDAVDLTAFSPSRPGVR